MKFCFLRNGEFRLKNRGEEKYETVDYKFNRNSEHDKKTKHNKLNYKNKIGNNIIKNIYQKNRKIFLMLKKVNIERLYVYEEIGVLTPLATALSIPVVSTVTISLVKNLQINPENFYYKINPNYTDLQFNLLLEADISFRIISVIFSIIKEKIAQINLKIRGGRLKNERASN